MKPGLTYDSLHNPFNNRFNYPVRCRRDEMQANAYKAWLRERNQCGFEPKSNQFGFETRGKNVASPAVKRATSNTLEPTNGEQIFVGGFALLVILLFLGIVFLRTL